MSLWLSTRPCNACADDYASAFEQAGKLYAQGQYADAAAAYQTLVQSGRVSAALYFNLGNACFKNHQLGYAIAYYRMAQNLAPRDSEIRANLQYARTRANPNGNAPAESQRAWLNWLALDEWTLLAAISGWIWFGLLTLGQWREEWGAKVRQYTRLVGVFWLVTMLCVGLRAQGALNQKPAVIVANDTTVRYGPLEEAREAFKLSDGTEVVVQDQQDNWLQIRDGAHRTGWLRRNQAVVIALN
jgi:tetratricopeptide (TPR) repeat protein